MGPSGRDGEDQGTSIEAAVYAPLGQGIMVPFPSSTGGGSAHAAVRHEATTDAVVEEGDLF